MKVEKGVEVYTDAKVYKEGDECPFLDKKKKKQGASNDKSQTSGREGSANNTGK